MPNLIVSPNVDTLLSAADNAAIRTNIELGTTSSPTFANLTLTSPSLASDAPVTISQTWGTTGTYTAAKVNVTETATANPASRLLDLQVGGVSLANFSKAGHLIFPSSSTVTPSGPGVGQWVGTLALFGTSGSLLVTGSGGALNISGNILLSWNNDTVLLRDSASGNTLALRNGAAAQTFNVYGTYTSESVYERMFMRYSQSALAFQVGTEQLGATSRPLEFFTNGTRKFAIAGSGINTSTFYGHDNTNSAILILRTLGGTTKAQFYVNPSGNCEFGLGFPAAGFPILLSESGNSYFNGGNVGIGTTAPQTRLDVHDDVRVGGFLYLDRPGNALANNYCYFKNRPAGAPTTFGNPLGLGAVEFVVVGTSGFIMGTTANVPLAFATTSAERVRILGNGNVGIGTASPTSKLQVSAGDIEVDTIAKGVILKSPDGTRYRITVPNGGASLTITAV